MCSCLHCVESPLESRFFSKSQRERLCTKEPTGDRRLSGGSPASGCTEELRLKAVVITLCQGFSDKHAHNVYISKNSLALDATEEKGLKITLHFALSFTAHTRSPGVLLGAVGGHCDLSFLERLCPACEQRQAGICDEQAAVKRTEQRLVSRSQWTRLQSQSGPSEGLKSRGAQTPAPHASCGFCARASRYEEL